MESPQLPTRFPCWVQAIYSFSGEGKNDLGFVEGEIIECLNAGDGSWWVGKLRRDRRMVGAFPSNFVKVLQDYQPAPRAAKPLPPGASTSHANGMSTPPPSTPQKSSSTFRKAFAAYASPDPKAAARQAEFLAKRGTPSPPSSVRSKRSFRPYSSMVEHKPRASIDSKDNRPPSPKIPVPIARASLGASRTSSARPSRPTSPQQQYSSRAPSPHPDPQLYRAPSPRPDQLQQFYSRPSSPQPPQHYDNSTDYYSHSRAPSPKPHWPPQAHSPLPPTNQDDSSPPPPPPPTHRIAYTRQNSPVGSPNYASSHAAPGQESPANSQRSGLTPSPLRDAMNDVMSSLDDMGLSQEQFEQENEEQHPPDIWSPEAFEELNTPTRRPRPHTAMGSSIREHSSHSYRSPRQQHSQSFMRPQASQPHLQSYVERMESRLNDMQDNDEPSEHQYFSPDDIQSSPPPLPLKNSPLPERQESVTSSSRPSTGYGTQTSSGLSRGTSMSGSKKLRHRKSAYELGKERLNRTFTVKSNATNSTTAQSTSTNGTDLTAPSLMSGYSAGGFSATSAGSLARKRFSRSNSIKQRPQTAVDMQRPDTAMSLISYHSSHATGSQAPPTANEANTVADSGLLGGLAEPASPKKRGFFKKLGDKVKTSTATAKLQSAPNSRPGSPTKTKLSGLTGIGGGITGSSKDASREMGLVSTPTGGVDWVQMRRDVNRSNSLSRNERNEKADRAQMMDVPVLAPVEDLESKTDGDEGIDGHSLEQSTDFQALNLTMVDKSARFVSNLPGIVTPAALAQNYVCRPHRSDVQKLRAIFTWVSERISWDEDFEGDVDARRVIQTKRGCAKEVAVLVAEMCKGVGIHAEIIRGYLKTSSEILLGQDLNDVAAHPNHWWNAVLADGEWRMIDCSLAAPTNPHRGAYSSAGNQVAEAWLFLSRPSEICYTHVPLLPEQQHLVPPVRHDILMALPLACPPYFKNRLQMWDFDTSLLYLDGLEMAQIQLTVPEDVECVAEVEARSFAQDADGDRFESGELVTKRALAQADFVAPAQHPAALFKRYTIKAVLPSLQNAAAQATLKIYAGRRGLMHGINSNPHPLAVTFPLLHEGTNPDYDFFTRHPTPHALRHELYVVGPQCRRLACNNTFVFGVRQHPASATLDKRSEMGVGARPSSSLSINRPGSAMSMTSTSASGSAYSNPSSTSSDGSGSKDAVKPAKLAIQSPSGKILRMSRKVDQKIEKDDGMAYVGSSWETIIKIGERGTWRGLVLADRTARWCVFGEWECI